MGQYHKVCNLDKKQFLHPHKAGDGLKLLEFGCSSNGTMTLLALLLARDNGKGGGDLHVDEDQDVHMLVGSWAGDRIAIVGDYHEKDDELIVPHGTGTACLGQDNPWVEGNDWKDITDDVLKVARCDQYLKQSMVDPKSGDGWRQRPLEA